MFTPSRTPEGQPLHCPVCQAEVRLEVSPLSGDAACPICGSLLWGEDRVSEPSAALSRAEGNIRRHCGRIQSLCAFAVNRDELLSGCLPSLVESLAAIGGAVWSVKKGALPERLVAHNLPAEAAGSRHSQMIAKAVAASKILPASYEGDDELLRQFLLLLAPIPQTRPAKLVVEIIQRPVENQVTQRGYMRFLNQVCDQIANSRAIKLSA